MAALRSCIVTTAAIVSRRWISYPAVHHVTGRKDLINGNEVSDVIPKKILVTGCLGQLGTDLVRSLRQVYGSDNVIASDIRKPHSSALSEGPFVYADVLNYSQLESLVVDFRIDYVVHLSSLLSAVGEQDVPRALKVNVGGFTNIFELAKNHDLRVVAPSSIAAFGNTSNLEYTPNIDIQRPSTVYGVSKVHMELLGEYYQTRYGVDFRCGRFGGVISLDEPGGGTTDYAMAFFDAACRKESSQHSVCYLHSQTVLPFIYMPDWINACMLLLETPVEKLTQRTYNFHSLNFTPNRLLAELRRYRPCLTVDYQPDYRQQIADSWPRVLDDSKARSDLNWSPKWTDLDSLTKDMLMEAERRAKVMYA